MSKIVLGFDHKSYVINTMFWLPVYYETENSPRVHPSLFSVLRIYRASLDLIWFIFILSALHIPLIDLSWHFNEARSFAWHFSGVIYRTLARSNCSYRPIGRSRVRERMSYGWIAFWSISTIEQLYAIKFLVILFALFPRVDIIVRNLIFIHTYSRCVVSLK